MRHFNILSIRFIVRLFLVTAACNAGIQASAQCPAGSVSNTGGTYNSGETVCISLPVTSSITLNNGAKMVVINNGAYTGNITANAGSQIIVQNGGTFTPTVANSFAATLTNYGTAQLGTAGLSLASGASIINNGSFNWIAWNQNAALTVTNNACGSMHFTSTTNLNQSGTVLTNKGFLNFASNMTLGNGCTLNNTGQVIFNGSFTALGRVYNQWKISVLNTFNSNSGDSIINLYQMLFRNSITFNNSVRNEGLLWTQGSLTINGAGSVTMNFSNAQLRINGALQNNGTLKGPSQLYVSGSINNNGTISGISNIAPLQVNQNINNGTRQFLFVNTSMTPYDTATYTNTRGFNDICTTTLPVELSPLQAVYRNNATQLSWSTYTEINTQNFYIEFSRNGVDFTTIGSTPAAGNTNSRVNYNYNHNIVTTGTLYYRIREVDIDGKVTYSNIASVRAGSTSNVAINVQPNPFTDKINCNIELSKAGPVTIILYNSNGSIIQRITQQAQAGINRISLNNLSILASGVYMVNITAGEQNFVQKVVK